MEPLSRVREQHRRLAERSEGGEAALGGAVEDQRVRGQRDGSAGRPVPIPRPVPLLAFGTEEHRVRQQKTDLNL